MMTYAEHILHSFAVPDRSRLYPVSIANPPMERRSTKGHMPVPAFRLDPLLLSGALDGISYILDSERSSKNKAIGQLQYDQQHKATLPFAFL